jgi:choline dehydrogenase-like flavoprotein
VLIIGSGAGGAAAAYRLVLGGLRVALLEKGAQLPRDGSTLDIRRVVHAGEFFSREAWVDRRGRALTPEEHFNVGGKTKWYGAALLRFAAHEFLADEAHACAPWPLTSGELAPYYAEAERLLGVRTFPCEPDLKRILAHFERRGSPWRAQPMPLALAADVGAFPWRRGISTASPRRAISRARPISHCWRTLTGARTSPCSRTPR